MQQTNSPYRHHRRKSSSITNHSPIPLFCSKPKKYTFYFAALTPQTLYNAKQNGKNYKNGNKKSSMNEEEKITLLQHGQLQFNFGGKNGGNSSISMGSPSPGSSLNDISILPPTITLIPPSYLNDKFENKLDIKTKAVILESMSNLTSIEWFYYGLMKKDTECVLIVTDSKLGLIHEIDSEFNITKPLAKICAQDNVGVVEILRFSNKYTLDSDTDTNYNTINNGDGGYDSGEKLKRIPDKGYNITWSTTKDGELIYGSTGMEYNTSIIRYNRSRELYTQDWTVCLLSFVFLFSLELF